MRTFNFVTAIEFDEVEAKKASRINLRNTTVINTDFHLYCNQVISRFDLIVGNPPYIRYQYFDKEQQDEADKIFNPTW
jgi:methylase of polypeptide subunit release factors